MPLHLRNARRGLTSAVLLTSLLAAGQQGWLEPRQFFVPVGTRMYVQHCLGDNFTAKPRSAPSRHIRRFLHLAPGRTTDLTLLATQADTLRSTVVFPRGGTNLLALRTSEALKSHEADQFNEYLRKAGLTSVIGLRATRNETDKPGREGYQRCLKTLVQVTGTSPHADDTVWHQRVGLPLELIPERNPYRLRSGDSLTISLLADGRPAAGQAVEVVTRPRTGKAGTDPVLRLRTDMKGRVRFRLPAASAVLVRSVRMVPHPSRDSADWQSTWTSLTFAGPSH